MDSAPYSYKPPLKGLCFHTYLPQTSAMNNIDTTFFKHIMKMLKAITKPPIIYQPHWVSFQNQAIFVDIGKSIKRFIL